MATGASNPLGPIVGGSTARRPSPATKLTGRYITMVGLSPKHVEAFYPHLSGHENAHLWDYMGDGPFYDIADFRANVEAKAVSKDPVFWAIIPSDQPLSANGSDNIVGAASLMRIDTNNRCIEVGTIMFSPQLQRTHAATEAMYLLAKHAFEDLGYRRYEWKCNALNAPSRRAALRLGFTFEGIFRKHMVVKGRNRDTAWYAMVDDEWPEVKRALEAWLNPANFDEHGIQLQRLEEMRK
ncbi:Uu.00g105870.m01.CDS01 [Anthostomella pinea]|uniref:Uu.00g105870.m01.CDS01 n=1 Tax=Anthostomella pinea TaxID=933095 RepID=A0AAI8YFR3_9PEZI|nr:Uu.00g105870.m01.CDS01 [Anthostomella pinea]